MTLQSPEYILTDAFASSIIYSQEILEDKEPNEQQLQLVLKFLETASKLHESVVKGEEAKRLLKQVSEVRF